MQRLCIKTRVAGDAVQRKTEWSNVTKTGAARSLSAVGTLGEGKDAKGRKETVSVSWVFFISFEELRIFVDSKIPVAKWYLFSL